jgi:hypothetical protein
MEWKLETQFSTSTCDADSVTGLIGSEEVVRVLHIEDKPPQVSHFVHVS